MRFHHGWMGIAVAALLLAPAASAQQAETGNAPRIERSDDDPIAHTRKSPAEIWIEIQAIQREMHLEVEQNRFDRLVDLGDGITARADAMFRITRRELDETHSVLAKRSVISASQIRHHLAPAAASNWPDLVAEAMPYIDSVVGVIGNAYPKEMLEPTSSDPAQPASTD
jgi:hypothetical protein